MRFFLSVLVGVAVAACGADRNPGIPVEPPGDGPPVHEVMVSPDSAYLVVGATAHLRAIEDVATGQPVESTFVWRAQDTTVVVVDSTGLVTARAAGRTVVIANDVRAPMVQGGANITVVKLTGGSHP